MRKLLGRAIGAYIAALLAVAEQVGQRGIPHDQRFAELLAERIGVGGQFGGELASQAGPLEAGPDEGLAEFGEVAGELVGGAQGVVVGPLGQRIQLDMHITVQHSQTERILGPEVVIERAFGTPEASRIASTVVPWKPDA